MCHILRHSHTTNWHVGQLHSFLSSALYRNKWWDSGSGRFSQWKGHAVFATQEAVWVSEPFWTLRRTQNVLPLPGTEPRFLVRPARSLVTMPTELPSLQCSSTVVCKFIECCVNKKRDDSALHCLIFLATLTAINCFTKHCGRAA